MLRLPEQCKNSSVNDAREEISPHLSMGSQKALKAAVLTVVG